MARNLVLSNGKSMTLAGNTKSAFSTTGGQAGQLAVSYYAFRQNTYIDINAGNSTAQLAAISAGGTTWRPPDLWGAGYLDVDGTMLTLPPGTTSIGGTEIFSQMFAENPSYYNGRTLVMDSRQGKFKGSGNAISISSLGAVLSSTTWNEEQNASGDNSTTVFTFNNAAGWNANQIHVYVGGYRKQHKLKAGTDYTVADNGSDLDVTFAVAPPTGTDNIFFKIHRREYVLDTDNWGSSPPRYEGPFTTHSIGTVSAVENWMTPSIFWKDEEDDFHARFDEPYKMFAPWWRSYFTFPHVVRGMDGIFDPMRSGACYPADMAEPDDLSIRFQAGSHRATNHELIAGGGVGLRQGHGTLPLLDFCKRNGKTPYLNVPNYMGLPVYPTTVSESIQTGGASQLGMQWLNPNEVDFGETITLSDEEIDGVPTSGVATLNLANKRIDFDAAGNFSHTSNDPNVIFKVDINYTDINGNPVTYTHKQRVLHNGGSNYYWWHQTGRAWIDNESHFDNHWSWDAWADWILDQLVAADWSPSAEVIIEMGNEIWNTADVFEFATGMSAGCGVVKAFHEANYNGNGYMTAKLKNRLDQRMTARSLSFNITMALGAWTDVAGYFADSRLLGYKGFWQSTEGGSLTGGALDAKMAEAQIFMTNYYSSPFNGAANFTNSNMTGLSGTANSDALIAAFDADEDQFWSDVYDWYADTTPAVNSDKSDIKFRVRWIEEKYDQIQAVAASHGTKVRGSYEGGSHDDATGIPSALQTHTGFAQSYYDHMYGTGGTGAAIWNLMVQRMRAKDPEFVVCAYGGAYSTDIAGNFGSPDMGQPWQFGAYQQAKNQYALAIENAGV